MPTVFYRNGFRFFFYSDEGFEPPHIHVIGRGGEIKIWMNPHEIAYVYNLKAKDQREALKLAQENAKLILEKWEKWHGHNRKKN